MALRTKLILSISLGIILSTLIVTVYGYFSLRTSMVHKEGERLESLAVDALSKVDMLLVARQREMGLLAQMGTISSSFEYDIFDQANDLLVSFAKNFAMYHAIYLTAGDGKLVACSLPEASGSGQGKFTAIAPGTATLGAPYLDSASGKYLLNISAPVLLNDKQVGTLTGSYDLADLFVSLDATKVTGQGQTEDGHLMVAQKDGVVLYSPAFERSAAQNVLKENLRELGMASVRGALEGKQGYLTEKDEHGHTSVTGYAPGKGTAVGLGAIVLHDRSEVMAGVYEIIRGLALLVAILILVGVATAVYLGNLSANPIQAVITGLASAAEAIAHSSVQMIASGKNLTAGATQQAAAIEEISASIHQASATVSQNAENAGEARAVVEETNKTMSEAHQAMSQLTATMVKISEVSANTAHIVKAIDEIAFQTNLLALNAAVEAARAGEAGAGFAVVAEEVRNLAMRSTKSAQETSQMIEETLEEIETGSSLVKQTAALFQQAVAGAEKIGVIIGEIASASQEQARGIDHVNSAISEVEKISQQSVFIAEQSSTAAHDLDQQSERLNQFVEGLELVVKGTASRQAVSASAAPPRSQPLLPG